jgi:hypothetical protein
MALSLSPKKLLSDAIDAVKSYAISFFKGLLMKIIVICLVAYISIKLLNKLFAKQLTQLE